MLRFVCLIRHFPSLMMHISLWASLPLQWNMGSFSLNFDFFLSSRRKRSCSFLVLGNLSQALKLLIKMVSLIKTTLFRNNMAWLIPFESVSDFAMNLFNSFFSFIVSILFTWLTKWIWHYCYSYYDCFYYK